MTYEDRKVVLESCRYVDEVFAEETWEQKADDIKKFGADIFVMGDDWKGKFDNLSKSCKVHYLCRTPLVSSTSIKEKTARSLSALNMHQA
jgi:glycerol-3-phosphate cytidylyltransferase